MRENHDSGGVYTTKESTAYHPPDRIAPQFADSIYVKSETHSTFGTGARNCRFTRSAGHGVAGFETVVLVSRPRTTPRSPMSRISRSTVQRATAMPSRPSWRQTLRAPYPEVRLVHAPDRSAGLRVPHAAC